jgi:subtilisin family serine protease
MADPRKKLNPMLRALADDAREVERARARRPASPGAGAPPPALVNVSVELQGDDLRPLEAAGLAPNARVGRFVHGRIPAGRLADLAAVPTVVRVRHIEQDDIMLDKSIPECRANALRAWDGASGTWDGLTGNGVIVGIIDTGIDFSHGAFRKPDGTSRILFLWDQSIDPKPGSGETKPLVGGVAADGVEYTKDQINAVLLGESNAMPIRQEDTNGHGTHVAGIAAGDGSERERCGRAFQYAGVAPEADLIIVKAGQFGPRGDGDTQSAAQYISEKADAEGKQAVINISLGTHFGPHDGTGAEIELAELLLGATMLRAIVVAAGNESQDRIHVKGTVPAGVGSDLTINFRIPSRVKENLWLDLWYPATGAGLGRLRAVVVAPDGRETNQTTADADNSKELTLPDGTRIRVFSELPSNENPRANEILVRLRPPQGEKLPAGTWQLRLENATPGAVQFDAWLEEIREVEEPPVFVDADLISEETTITTYASAAMLIAVANYQSSGRVGELTASSSRGPRRGATDPDKPELAAPGTMITAPRGNKPGVIVRCCTACCRDRYTEMQGTSMAAPHVAGAIALMLEANPDLTWDEIRAHLVNTALSDAQTGPTPNRDWGAGKLNVEALIDAVLPTPIVPPAGTAVASAMGSGAQRGGAARRRVPPPSAMDLLRERLLLTERGRTYADLVERHFEDVYALINGNKRVATVWHRNGGPTLLSQAMRAASQPSTPLPMMIEGEPLRRRLERILAMLKRYGSARLAEDIEAHWEAVAAFEGLAIDQILARLEAGRG